MNSWKTREHCSLFLAELYRIGLCQSRQRHPGRRNDACSRRAQDQVEILFAVLHEITHLVVYSETNQTALDLAAQSRVASE